MKTIFGSAFLLLAQAFYAHAYGQTEPNLTSEKIDTFQPISAESLESQGVCNARQSDGTSDRNGAWLGVSIDDLTPEAAASAGFYAFPGVVVTTLRPGSPAAKAGIQRNDILIEFDGRKIIDTVELTKNVRAAAIGKSVEMVLFREREEISVEVVLGDRENRQLILKSDDPKMDGAAIAYGILFQKPLPSVLETFGLPDTDEGLVVLGINYDCIVAEVLQPGDVVLEIDWEPVNDPKEAIEKLSAIKAANAEPVAIYVRRGDVLFYETLRF